MRNLNVSEVDETTFGPDELPLSATTFDTSTGNVIYTLGPTVSKPVVELRRSSRIRNTHNGDLITSWDAPCPLEDLESDEVLSLHYFYESLSICVVFAGGDIVLVREKPSPDQERIEIVGSIDVGITAAQWSWNASLLALVTRTGSFILMSQQLDPLNETPFQEADLSLSKHVSVGWGKKETQFQGKRAKAMKDPTMPDFVDEGKPSCNDDGRTVITWRGDGAYVAVNSALLTSRRVIRVYSAEGVLDSVSEPVDGLESALSWRPYGNLIASIRRSPTALEVLFFERNGLRHGKFNIRLNEDEMNSFGLNPSLHWNCDSSVLAIKLTDRIYFWTMGNYHYYLKQEIRLREVQTVDWHTTDPLRFNVSSPTCLRSISMDLDVLRGSTFTPFDYGVVAVVDGKTLKLTPLKHVNSPPPMAFIDVPVDDHIIACAISRTCQRIAILTHEHIYLCQWAMMQATRKATDPSIRHSNQVAVKKLRLPSSAHQYLQVVIRNDDRIYLLSPVRRRGLEERGELGASCQESIWVNTNHTEEEIRLSEVHIAQDTQQLITDREREVVYICKEGGVYPLSASASNFLSEVSSRCEIFHLRHGEDSQPYIVSLWKSQQLTIGAHDIDLTIPNVTSFVVSDAHIIYTTANHLLKFIHLDDPRSMRVSEDTPEIDERCRAIERGAVIVTVIPSSYAVVLQMPRGNLETIYPRILVLSGIRSHIRDREYRKAFLACQTHQVDLNILYDYAPDLFLNDIALFIDQLRKPGRVDEFLQKLKDEDVTKTLYKDTSLTHNAGEEDLVSQIGDKINKICDSMITNLQSRDATYQPNIITAHVCKKPPDLIAALSLVSSLRQSSSEEADLAIAHLCFLTDTNRLYDTALALYDLELTLLVAQNAQRDPREYMPFLQSLQALPVLRRQYTIDNHLKKFAKALVSLHALREHDEMEAYTIKHNLYTDAIRLYQYDTMHRETITRLYAGHLSDTSKHAQAATLYESLSDYTSAYPLYALAHQWRESLTCISLAPQTNPSQIETLARSLATTCTEETRDYRSAATIHLEYMSDALTAAQLLCRGSYFAEATRILSHPAYSSRQQFTPSEQLAQIVDVALTRKFGEILELIADCQTQLSVQVPRIEELRVKKAEDPFAFFGGEGATTNGVDGVDVPDNVSLAGTDTSTVGGQSMFTRYGGGAGGSQVSTKFGGTVRSDVSRKTSKTRRKEERKRAQGKKGSVYEEEYLVKSVGRLIERVNGVHEEVGRLVSGLERRGLSGQAEKVGEVMDGIQRGCEDARGRVWKGDGGRDGMVNGVVLQVDEESYRPTGADGVLFESQIEGQGVEQLKAPEVKVWKGSMA